MTPPTGTEAAVCADIAHRQQLGITKYGTTVADNPLPLRQWLQHAYEECLDQAIYLRRAIEALPDPDTEPTWHQAVQIAAAAVTRRATQSKRPPAPKKPPNVWWSCPHCFYQHQWHWETDADDKGPVTMNCDKCHKKTPCTSSGDGIFRPLPTKH